MKLIISFLFAVLALTCAPQYAQASYHTPAIQPTQPAANNAEKAHGKVLTFVNKARIAVASFLNRPGNNSQDGTLALVFGILGLVILPPLSIAAIVLGARGTKRSHGRDGLAKAGLILGIIGCALWLLAIIVVVLVLSVLLF